MEKMILKNNVLSVLKESANSKSFDLNSKVADEIACRIVNKLERDLNVSSIESVKEINFEYSNEENLITTITRFKTYNGGRYSVRARYTFEKVELSQETLDVLETIKDFMSGAFEFDYAYRTRDHLMITFKNKMEEPIRLKDHISYWKDIILNNLPIGTWNLRTQDGVTVTPIYGKKVSTDSFYKLDSFLFGGGHLYKVTETPITQEILDMKLEDDDQETGGISFLGETVKDFLEEIQDENEDQIKTVEELNEELKDNGIKPIEIK